MDAEARAQEHLKAGRDVAAQATGISLIIFSALLISAISDFSPRIPHLREAAALQLSVERADERIRSASLGSPVTRANVVEALEARVNQLNTFVKKINRLRELGKPVPAYAEQLGRDKAVLDNLMKFLVDPKRPRTGNILSDEADLGGKIKEAGSADKPMLRAELAILRSQTAASQIDTTKILQERRRRASELFEHQREAAAQTKFKLFGFEFGVNGLWAPLVWLLFLLAGIAHLAFSRAAILTRFQSAYALLRMKLFYSDIDMQDLAGSLPVWTRPVRIPGGWLDILVRPIRADMRSEWLSIIVIVLAAACIVLSPLILTTAVLATGFLTRSGGSHPLRYLYGALLCIITGGCATALAQWLVWERSPFNVPNESGDRDMSRRALLIGGLIGTSTAAVYVRPFNRTFREWMLQKRLRLEIPAEEARASAPRYRRKRRPKAESLCLLPGFYVDGSQTIHCVMAQRRQPRSLQKIDPKELRLLQGELDPKQGNNVHRGSVNVWAHTMAAEQVRKGNAAGAFSVVQSLLQEAPFEKLRLRAGPRKVAQGPRMPNVQLYDLLARLAAKTRRPDLIQTAQAMFRETQANDRRSGPNLALADFLRRTEVYAFKAGRTVRLPRILARIAATKNAREAAEPAVKTLDSLKAERSVQEAPTVRLKRAQEMRLGRHLGETEGVSSIVDTNSLVRPLPAKLAALPVANSSQLQSAGSWAAKGGCPKNTQRRCMFFGNQIGTPGEVIK